MKDDYISWADECLEFENGSKIIGVNLAKGEDCSIINGEVQNKNVRGLRSKFIIYDDMNPQSLFRRFINMIKGWFKK